MNTPLTIRLFGRKAGAFRFFGVLGFIAATILGFALGAWSHLRFPLLLLMVVTAAGVFYVLASAVKLITGEESLVYYHHEIAILISCALLLYALGQPVLPYLDLTVLGIGTLLGFGRLGCHSVGCCHGRPAKKGVVYGHAHVEAGFTHYYEWIPLLPVQLVESGFVFVIVAIGSALVLGHWPPGTALIVYTLVYGSFRFAIEFFRGDEDRGYWQGLSEAQWTTLILMLGCTVLSAIGWLPYYGWEIVVVALVFLSSLFIVLRFGIDGILIRPRHIGQIASALQESNDPDAYIRRQERGRGVVHIFQTDLGLKLSSGRLLTEDASISHYTLSCERPGRLTIRLVKKIGEVIRQLERHKEAGAVIQKNEDVFHIVFKYEFEKKGKPFSDAAAVGSL
jgi:prolipoprotein diacylglyceryltransferase